MRFDHVYSVSYEKYTYDAEMRSVISADQLFICRHYLYFSIFLSIGIYDRE